MQLLESSPAFLLRRVCVFQRWWHNKASSVIAVTAPPITGRNHFMKGNPSSDVDSVRPKKQNSQRQSSLLFQILYFVLFIVEFYACLSIFCCFLFPEWIMKTFTYLDGALVLDSQPWCCAILWVCYYYMYFPHMSQSTK